MSFQPRQKEHPWMSYPRVGWRRFVFKLPLYLWRMGLGRLLPANFLVLTTTGRKSGLPRHTMLEHGQIDNCFYIGSGWGHQSDWARNLATQPLATVQTARTSAISVRAVQSLDAAELSEVYRTIQGKSPAWQEYLEAWNVEDTEADFIAGNRDGRLLTYRLEPVVAATPPPLPTDLRWIWGWVLGGVAFALALVLLKAIRP
ncbi:MAG: nitroreductase family deazaflavin-dependent oxidoreductase [Anaerolineae bacterium]|nr:nitroreductase family deazaflavin-dependent oxidoreductase [Anaerolineae bacterium]